MTASLSSEILSWVKSSFCIGEMDLCIVEVDLCIVEVNRSEKQLRGETAARQQLELQLDRLANQVLVYEELINGVTMSKGRGLVVCSDMCCCLFICALYL